jgi:hypothetical protein
MIKSYLPRIMTLLVALGPLAACGIPTGPLGMPQMGGGPGTPFNDKNYADPHPESSSDAAQRAAYQASQNQQRAAQQMSTPDLSKMSCSGGSIVTTGANAGSMVGSTHCHN